jgi:hypothetical protein
VLGLIGQRILATRRNDHVFHAIAIEIAEHGCDLGYQREALAKLLPHELVVDFASCRIPLSESWKQDRDTERQE